MHERFFDQPRDAARILAQFIKEIDLELDKEQLTIVNTPDIFTNPAKLDYAQQLLRPLVEWEKHQVLKITTEEKMIHAKAESIDLLDMPPLEIKQFYQDYAKKILSSEKKPVTCDGISIVAFAIGAAKLPSLKYKIDIDLCDIRNWTHTLLRLTLNSQFGIAFTCYYDPWYQRVFSKDSTQALIPAEYLAKHMNTLVEISKDYPLIVHRDVLYDNIFTEQPNKSKDFTSYLTCSTSSNIWPTLIADVSEKEAAICSLS